MVPLCIALWENSVNSPLKYEVLFILHTACFQYTKWCLFYNNKQWHKTLFCTRLMKLEYAKDENERKDVKEIWLDTRYIVSSWSCFLETQSGHCFPAANSKQIWLSLMCILYSPNSPKSLNSCKSPFFVFDDILEFASTLEQLALCRTYELFSLSVKQSYHMMLLKPQMFNVIFYTSPQSWYCV